MNARKAPLYQEGPWWGRSRAFFTDPLEFSRLNGLKYGPIFEVPVPFRKVFVLTGSEEIRYVLQSNHRNYLKSPFYNALKLALGQGLLTSEGALWKHQRRLMQPAFYKSALEGLYTAMRSETIKYCDELTSRLEGNTLQVDLLKEMMRVTASIVLQTLFSAASPLPRDAMYKMMVSMQEYVMMRALRPYLFPLAWLNGSHHRFLQDRKQINEALYHMIDDRMGTEHPPHDLLSLLTHARDEETGDPMDRHLIRDELITLFAAGHETSANALVWTLYLLGQHPEKLQILQQEADSVIGDRFPELSDLPKLTYTRQVIEEGMRLYPPAYAVGRQTIEDDTIGGFKVPKDAIMFLSIYALHRDPNIYSNPEAFYPERFGPETTPPPKQAYIPFGFGPRKCIGYQFAMMEMQLLLPVLIRRFSFGFGDQPVERQTLITLRPKGGMQATISPRH